LIKLIATDLDGTLMSTDHLTVSPRTVDALKKAHIKGVKIAIATGRPLALVDNVISQVPFVDYVIYSNGACVYDLQSKKIIYSNLIPNKDSVGLINFFLENKVFFEIYVEGKSYYQLGTEELFVKVAFPQEFVDEVAKTMTGCENLVEFLGDSDVEKITLYSVKNEDFEKFKKEFLLYNMSVASSFVGNLEATVGTADKGEAVKGICDVMGITADNCMTFGDAGNDTPMLKFAKYSFAMANGTDECKASAKHIAKSNGEDGLAIAVEEYVLGEK
jgi:hypothetical protein